jgi:hypothetical protein
MTHNQIVSTQIHSDFFSSIASIEDVLNRTEQETKELEIIILSSNKLEEGSISKQERLIVNIELQRAELHELARRSSKIDRCFRLNATNIIKELNQKNARMFDRLKNIDQLLKIKSTVEELLSTLDQESDDETSTDQKIQQRSALSEVIMLHPILPRDLLEQCIICYEKINTIIQRDLFCEKNKTILPLISLTSRLISNKAPLTSDEITKFNALLKKSPKKN